MTPADTQGASSSNGAPSPLDLLREIYDRIGAAQAESLASMARRGRAIACPEGCGSCCESFVPDILPVEAGYIADWLLRSRPGLAAAVLEWDADGLRSSPACPFHEPDRRGGGCGVYPARPLVCRLFGYASVRDREGAASYSLCKMMPSREGRRSWSGEELECELGTSLPVMADYAAAAVAIAPEEASGRALLTAALPAELRRRSLLIRLASLESGVGDGDGDGDEPEPSTPSPRAA
jgi:Fe-S-cluster containining protein